MNTPKLVLFASFALCASTWAQAERSCRILFLDRPVDAPKTLHLFNGVTSQEVELPSMNLSPIYKLPAGQLKLRLLPAPADDPNTVSPDAPSVDIPEAYTDFYLVVASAPDNKIAPVSMSVFNATADYISPGQMLWINLSEKTIKGTLGDVKITLQPDASEVIGEPRKDKGDYPVTLQFLMKGNDSARPLCETKWQYDPRIRTLVFIVSQKGRTAPRVFSVTDYREAAK